VRDSKELLWVEQLRNWQAQLTDRKEFAQSLKGDFFKDRIFIITPENDVIDLPAGATPVDFAYHIHSDVGDHCIGAKVNGKVEQLDYELNSGDVVEIVTQRGKKPSENWLRFAKTTLAKRHIKSALREKRGIKTTGKKIEPYIEFHVVSQGHPGYLKEITAAFASLKINITSLQSETDHRKAFSAVKVRCDILPKMKLEDLLLRLKKIRGTKEANYRVNR
jgi:(p)ppGpp synthase/HD superfamily hydrolase